MTRLHLLRIGRDQAVVVPVGADHVGQHLRITRIRLGPRRGVPVSVARRRHRVHRIHLVPGRDERSDEQATVGLDPDHHLARLSGVTADHVVEPRDAGDTLAQPATGQPFPVHVFHIDVVVGLGPVHSHKDHLLLLSIGDEHTEPEDPTSSLMDQCSRHDIPPAVTGDLTDRQGHDLDIELETL